MEKGSDKQKKTSKVVADLQKKLDESEVQIKNMKAAKAEISIWPLNIPEKMIWKDPKFHRGDEVMSKVRAYSPRRRNRSILKYDGPSQKSFKGTIFKVHDDGTLEIHTVERMVVGPDGRKSWTHEKLDPKEFEVKVIEKSETRANKKYRLGQAKNRWGDAAPDKIINLYEDNRALISYKSVLQAVDAYTNRCRDKYRQKLPTVVPTTLIPGKKAKYHRLGDEIFLRRSPTVTLIKKVKKRKKSTFLLTKYVTKKWKVRRANGNIEIVHEKKLKPVPEATQYKCTNDELLDLELH